MRERVQRMQREVRELVQAPPYSKVLRAEGILIDLVKLLDEMVTELETLKGTQHE